MSTRCPPAARLALMLWLPLAAAGCVSLHSNQPVQQQYLLSLSPGRLSDVSGPGGAGIPGAEDTLQVLLPRAAPGLGTDGIAVRRPGQRLDYFAGARWAAAAPEMLQTLVVEALRRQGRFRLVEPDSGPFEARYLLSLELTRFEADYADGGAPQVRVTLVCTFGRRVGREVLAQLTVRGTAAAQANHMRAVIAAFQQATDAAVGQLAAQLAPPAAAGAAAASR